MSKLINYSFFIFLYVINFQYNFAQVTASFTVDINEGCPPLFATFTSTSSNAVNFQWNFGNNKTSSEEIASTTYLETGIYSVTLIVDDGSNFDTIIVNDLINVFEKPESNFTENSLSFYCEDDNLIEFTNLSVGANTFFWDFGDGNFSFDTNTTHQFSQDGEFLVKLKASNEYCDSLFSVPITIYPTPILTGTVNENFSCDSNYNFSFSANSSNATITDWNWDFGNNVSLSSVNSEIEFSFVESGMFFPKLISTSNNNCVDSFFFDTIFIPNQDQYLIQSFSTLSGCPPLDVNFEITPSASIEIVNWDFGDGNILDETFTINNIYQNSGIFNVNSSVTDTNGCIQYVTFNEQITVDLTPTGQYSISNSEGCPPLDVEFNIVTDPSNSIIWEFGDTISPNSTNQTVNNTYLYSGTFYPTLSLTSLNGCVTDYVLEPVQAGLTLTNFSANPTSGCAKLEVDFTNSAPDFISEFFWDFGDGNTSTEANPTHIYDTIGEYTVTFSCSDSTGCSSRYVINNMITTYGEDDVELPNQDTIFACSPYTFTADASNIGESYWNWDFGDGEYGLGSNISHQYTESGIYNVKLNADAPNSCMYNILNYATIVIDDDIKIDLDITVNTECDNGYIDVVNNSIGVTDHLWDMGDGGVVRTADINHSYNTSKSYFVSYQALSESGCLVVETIAVIFSCDEDLNPVPQAEIEIIEDTTQADTLITGPLLDPVTNEVITQKCGPELINLNTPYPNADSVFWDFGDGYTSREANPSHLYQNAGTFDLSHYAYFAGGDIETLIIKNFVDQYLLDPSFTLNKTNLCNEAEYEFENFSNRPTSWEWKIDSTIISNESSGNILLPLNDSVKILSLKIEDDYGCVNESQQSLFLYQPLVLIEDTNFACNSVPTNFTASVIGDPEHYWILDTDTLGTDTTLNHSFPTNGIYQITLQLDDQGCIREIPIDSIEIYQPDASFSPSSPSPICNTDSILFIANDRSFSSNKYKWSGANILGNGDSTWIQFNDEGKQLISLSITKNTCTNIINSDSITVNKAKAFYSFNQINYCIPINVVFEDSSVNPVEWEWNFGDNSTSNEENPFHTFNTMPEDSIKLIIIDINGCRDSTTSFIVNDLDAEFFADDTLICANNPVVFNGVDNIVNTWNWDFGDGNTSSDSIPTHYYENAGTYEVKLAVSDGQGCNDTVVKTNYIEVQKVDADFVFSVPNECPSVTVFFTNNSTGGTNFLWDFGDGANNIQNNNSVVAHEYDSIGYYNPSLIASNEGGCIDTLIITDTLIIPGPILKFSVEQIGGCDSLTVVISDSSTNNVDYTWDFGDGNSSSSNPNDTTITHTYTNPGVYNIILIGLDAANCPNTYVSPDTINHYITPVIDVAIEEPNICVGSSVGFQNNTVAESHYWIYNDQIYTDQITNITILDTGINEILYSVSNGDESCVDSTVFEIIGHQIPNPTINSETIVCENSGTFLLTAVDQGGVWSGDYIDTISGEINLLESGSGSFDFSYHIYGYCPTQSDIISIEVIASPEINVTILDTNICLNSSINPVNNTIADNHNWVYNNVNYDDSSPEILIDLEGVNQLVYTASNGAINCSNNSIYNIIGYATPDPTINSDSVICENLGLFTLTSIGVGGIWRGLNIDSVSGEVDLLANGPGFFQYTYEIESYCPTQIDTITIEIIENVESHINPIADYCEQTDTIQLTAFPENGVWSGLNNTHLSNGFFMIDSLEDGYYEVYYTSSNLCPDTDTSTILILPKPEINVEIIQEKPCISFPVSIVNNSSNIDNEIYSWYINDSLYYDSIINFTEPYFILDTGFYELKTVITNQYNCKIDYTFNDSIIIYDSSALKNAEIIRTTVFNNESIFTEWKDTSLKINPLAKNILYRKVNNEDYEFISELEPSVHHYLDKNVDVFNNSYTYYVVSRNICDVNSNNSNIGSSILLRFEKPEDSKTRLFWNDYIYWEDGIDRYELQKINVNNQWEIIETIGNSTNSIIIDE
tara:strand:+ start:17727 stop:23681 length:5955 start_codon:yes stop_codon:yes gene_type:complete